MKSLLDQIESRIQKLIESSMLIFPGQSTQKSVAIEIISELKEILQDSINSEGTIPNSFEISVHPDIYDFYVSDDAWINQLKTTLNESAEELDAFYSGAISIQFLADPVQEINTFSINVSSAIKNIEKTAVMKPVAPPASRNQNQTEAYLILPNRDFFPLSNSMVQIGRKQDNQLILDNPSVSRNHAQIRKIEGNYVIFDLNSTSGTFINGVRTKKSILKPGDVISIANYPLVYVEDKDSNGTVQGSTAEIPRIVDSK